jgi:ABC-type antimicrobial peptide transport system permease subunit
MVLKEVALLTLVGIALGVAAALSLSQLVRSQLFGISPSDSLTIVMAAVTLALVALAAGYIPARRASRVQPILALRYE